MKLLIACDMEGITGVVAWNQVDPSHPDYLRFRHIMTADINAAIRGAFKAGVDEIVVSDGHWIKTNILIEEIDPRVRLNSGTPSPVGMMEGIDGGVDCVFFVGYHARNGARNATLAHTWSNTRVSNVWLNERVIGEIGLNACVAGQFGAPVLMISGDYAACKEATEWIPGVETAVIKIGTAYTAAECLPQEKSLALIGETAEKAIQRFIAGTAPLLVKPDLPVKITLEFVHPGMADNAILMPNATRLDGRTIEFVNPTILDAYQQFRAAVILAA